jgi:hypothetical protein
MRVMYRAVSVPFKPEFLVVPRGTSECLPVVVREWCGGALWRRASERLEPTCCRPGCGSV